MAQSQTKAETWMDACPNCGSVNYLGELFVTEPHGPEYACRGCVAVYLARDTWP